MKSYLTLVPIPAALLLASASITQAATLYHQDFSASTATSTINGVLVDNTGYDADQDETITGGSAAALSTNGDYTIELNRTTAFASGDGYILNETGDLGFKAIDTEWTFETGTISFTHDSTLYSGTVFFNASLFNFGGEFLSLNSVTVTQNDLTEEVTLSIAYNAFGDFNVGGNDTITLSTNFGAGGDVTGFDITTELGLLVPNVTVPDTTYNLTLAAIPEPSTYALLAGCLTLGLAIIRRRR